MEKVYLYVFYNLFMASLYISIKAIGIYTLLTMLAVSVCSLLYFGKEDRSLLCWQCAWGSLILLFLLRDLNLVEEIWLILAFILCFSLIATVSITCYVIMNQRWTDQLFMLCALYWVVFHDSFVWLQHAPFMLLMPLICMAYFRIGKEHVSWVFLLFFEILYDSKVLSDTAFAFAALVYLYIIYTHNGRAIALMVLTMPIALPCFGLFCLYNYYKYDYTITKTYDTILVSETDPELTPVDTL